MAIESSRDPKAFKEFEHDGWETISAGYEQHFARLTSQVVPAILDAVGITHGMRLLDVCTGPAMLAGAAIQRGAEVVGLDFSSEVIEIAKRNVPGAAFQQGDAQDLPFADGSFDAVVCGYGVIHVPEPEKALLEMYRVLRTGGRFATSVWEAPKPTNGFGLLFGSIKEHGNLDVPLPHGPDFFQFSDHGKMTSALQDTGFREVTVQTVKQMWDLDEPLGIINAIMEGAVRARGLLLVQTESTRSAIANAVKNGMEQYRSSEGHYRVPMPALVGSGTK
jgi:ubiquinone/menaquinone biosynthesis C-methylase UbiE